MRANVCRRWADASANNVIVFLLRSAREGSVEEEVARKNLKTNSGSHVYEYFGVAGRNREMPAKNLLIRPSSISCWGMINPSAALPHPIVLLFLPALNSSWKKVSNWGTEGLKIWMLLLCANSSHLRSVGAYVFKVDGRTDARRVEIDDNGTSWNANDCETRKPQSKSAASSGELGGWKENF